MSLLGPITAAVLVLSITTVACSGGRDGPCALRNGTYALKFERRDGDCPDFPEQIYNVHQEQSSVGKSLPIDPPCSGNASSSADNCRTEVNQTCPIDGGRGGHTELAGSVEWDDDGAGGHGTLGARGYDASGGLFCSGSYNLIYERQ